jgi:hypothetical protein
MPSPIAHLAAGAALWGIWDQWRPATARPVSPARRVLELGGFLGASMLPDLDAVAGVLTGDLYNFHNQEMHSFAAGLVAALLFAVLLGRKYPRHFSPPVFWITLVSYWLHLLMDAVTYGRGLRLFWPFRTERIPPPVEVFGGLRWSEGLWYRGHWITVGEESVFALLLLLCVWAYRQRAGRQRG